MLLQGSVAVADNVALVAKSAFNLAKDTSSTEAREQITSSDLKITEAYKALLAAANLDSQTYIQKGITRQQTKKKLQN